MWFLGFSGKILEFGVLARVCVLLHGMFIWIHICQYGDDGIAWHMVCRTNPCICSIQLKCYVSTSFCSPSFTRRDSNLIVLFGLIKLSNTNYDSARHVRSSHVNLYFVDSHACARYYTHGYIHHYIYISI
jgi:hypothetical protein